MTYDTIYAYKVKWSYAFKLFNSKQFYNVHERIFEYAAYDGTLPIRHHHPTVQCTTDNMARLLISSYATISFTKSPAVLLQQYTEKDIVLTWEPIQDQKFELCYECNLGKEIGITRVFGVEVDAGLEAILYHTAMKIEYFQQLALDNLHDICIKQVDDKKWSLLEQTITQFTKYIASHPYENTIRFHRYYLLLQLLTSRCHIDALSYLTYSISIHTNDTMVSDLRYMLLDKMKQQDIEELYEVVQDLRESYPHDDVLLTRQELIMKELETMYQPHGIKYNDIEAHFTSCKGTKISV